MAFLSKFIKLMKSEPARQKKNSQGWVIDESKCLSMSEITRLRKVSSEGKKEGLQSSRFNRIRDWFMIELGLNAGLRVAEMASLKHSDLLIDDVRSSIIVVGKGGKKRSIWISSTFKRMCQDYIRWKKRFDYAGDPGSCLLNNLKGSEITKRALQKSFKSICNRAKLPAYYSIHCLRHTYTTFLLKASNYNYRFAQQQLGHVSIRTTQVYAGVLESDARQALERIYHNQRPGESPSPGH